jgi:hypothetical protein
LSGIRGAAQAFALAEAGRKRKTVRRESQTRRNTKESR